MKGAKANRNIKYEIYKLLNDSIISTEEQIDSVYKILSISRERNVKLSDLKFISISSYNRVEMNKFNKIIQSTLGSTLLAFPIVIFITKAQNPIVFYTIGGLLIVESIVAIIEGNKRLYFKHKWVVKQVKRK